MLNVGNVMVELLSDSQSRQEEGKIEDVNGEESRKADCRQVVVD